MKKIHIYIILLLGLFLMPNAVLACGKSNDSNGSCSMEMTSKSDSKKSCCGTKSCSKNEKQKSCDGKCGHSLCTTSSVSLSFLMNSSFESLINVFDFSIEKQKFYPSVSFTSDGYSSIWLIPKIG
ncbi:hypothetical protein SLW70_06370 [Flavobacterium sp. NG2]|uniref:hypothetical protein n=1 Tax=Flavobacterium sp. NG2 TaxID=3097547 RepID=UPI002A81C8C9|nr:hypothetical protein [Flavobacterium sp. NG2]WPR72751.1 hypothetical protein SLW70_06370 [Flavobacterium sp. NG2]